MNSGVDKNWYSSVISTDHIYFSIVCWILWVFFFRVRTHLNFGIWCSGLEIFLLRSHYYDNINLLLDTTWIQTTMKLKQFHVPIFFQNDIYPFCKTFRNLLKMKTPKIMNTSPRITYNGILKMYSKHVHISH